WPGADPEEVVERICRKLEEAVKGIPGIRQFDTTASESVGTLVVEVSENADVTQVKDRVRNAVDAISTFPVDAEQPITEELLLRREVALIALSGEKANERDLKEWAEQIKDELRRLPGVSQAMVLGGRSYEIGIEVSEEKLREYGLTFSQVASIVRANSLNLSGGVMRTRGEEIRLRTIGRNYVAEDFARIVLLSRPNGDIITLDKVATIRDSFTEDRIASRFNGHPCVSVAVLKTKEEDMLAIDAQIREYVKQKQAVLPPGFFITAWGGTADILRDRIDLLVRNGRQGLFLVFVILWLFLGPRLSFWVSMGMPISVAGALAILWATGQTLNMISLFAFIMVLGIVVDDTIVVGEAIYAARKRGVPPLRAAIEGVSEVGLPVLGSVTTTIAAFAPLLAVKGIMGKFIFILPVVVILCLTISMIEALFMFPAYLGHLPDPNQETTSRNPLLRFSNWVHRSCSRGIEAFTQRIYLPVLKTFVAWRYPVLAGFVGILVLSLGLVAGGFVRFFVFAKLDGNVITAIVEFPNGTPFEVTERAVAQVEAALKRIDARTKIPTGEPLIKNLYTLVGSTISDTRPTTGSHVGAVRAELADVAIRGISTDELSSMWEKEVSVIPGILALTISGLQTGPPGAPIEIWIQGEDMRAMLEASEKLQEKLRSYEGLYQVKQDFRPGKNEFRLRLRPEARTLGLTVSDLARQINAGYFGEEAVRIQRGRDDIRVRVRYPFEERRRLDYFENIRIRTPQGQEVPLLSVAEIEFGPGYASINRTDGLRRVAVTSEVNYAISSPSEIMRDLEEHFMPQLRKQYPGLYFSFQGDKRKTSESLGSLFYSYPVALLVIYIIIAAIFRAYFQPLLIMVTIPFGIVGAILGHLVMGYDMTMMSIFGIVALSGIVVNDAIVLIDRFNQNIIDRVPFLDAVYQAGARRFVAIFLTTATTVGGLAPIMLERSFQARFLIPMAISLSFGLLFATLLTLLFIPVLLVILNDIKRGVRFLLTGVWPEPEEVESAIRRRVNDEEPAGEASGGFAGTGQGTQPVTEGSCS
ncbi:MAG TPA: efflux RND transporter permease subunit, partial [Candidatus Hydrogenedentes bacterium]|nr:efflux RND transporter permease subunit [Candidatus Hydrogenedentota bacterium]